ncbi:MAG: DUF1566 domain-containing protein [Deltaproteobacteria bacterium]|nr:DUF1566 domain-containing protein [Deltaproteobacteria bacterium]
MSGIRTHWWTVAMLCALAAGPGCSLTLFTDDPIDADGGDDGGGETDVEPDADVEPDEAGDGDGDVPGECGNGSLDDGEECDDGNDVSGDGCEPETCEYSCHEAADCEDGNPCTMHGCTTVDTGRVCSSAPNPGVACDDDDPCTHTDRCDDAGSCAGTSYTCEPGVCEASSECDGGGGCTVVFDVPGEACDDGDACTTPDTCDGTGNCGGPNTCGCPGGTDAECATFEDDDLCNGTLICVERLCEVDPATVVSCPADPPCKSYACDPVDGSCDLSDLPAGTSCEDGTWCNGPETCDGSGTCLPGTPPCPVAGCVGGCDESGDVCTPATSGTTCRPATGPCDPAETCNGTATGCPADALEADGTACDDGNDCTVGEACATGVCTGGAPPDEVCDGTDNDCDGETDEVCDSVVPCADDTPCTPTGRVCNENWGICVVRNCTGQPNYRPCEAVTSPDRSYDICVAGSCVSPGCGDATCNAPGPAGAPADTLQRSCHDNAVALTDCPGTPGTTACETTDFCGQDAQYGWDTTHDPTERFTRVADAEPVVTDEVTRLVWQGCSRGQAGPDCAGTATMCDWSTALAYCDSLDWGGVSDWRLPNEYELQSIVHYGRGSAPRVSLSAFPATYSGYYWTSATNAEDSSEAWIVAFSYGSVLPPTKTTGYAVRCVRGGSVVRALRFSRRVVGGDPVVNDAATDLMWQGCPDGMTGDASSCGGTARTSTWQGALDACQDSTWAGYTDWYLPSVLELHGIVDSSRFSRAADPAAFPATPVEHFWTSSTFVVSADATSGWSIDFEIGRTPAVPKTDGYRVRCVRRLPPEACNGLDDDGDGTTDEGCAATVGTRCAADATCASGELVCNERWGICVVASCAGQPDLQPCETVTSPDRSYDICSGGTCVSPGCGTEVCNPPGPGWPPSDTNQRTCYDDSTALGACPGTPGTATCEATPFCGQDAQYGWDTTHGYVERWTSSGVAEPVVRDRVTGLQWMACAAGHSGSTCAGTAPLMTWDAAVSYCEALSWNGDSDWRLPSRFELLSIVDFGRSVAPMIDTAVFPNAPSTHYWTIDSDADADPAGSTATTYAFNTGYLASRAKTNSASVRCVRSEAAGGLPVIRFRRDDPTGTGQPIVRDAVTGLVWQGCVAGRTGGACTGSATLTNWRTALDYCQDLAWAGFDDWYLPDLREIVSIVDPLRDAPAVRTDVFPSTALGATHSSTTNALIPTASWTGDSNAGRHGSRSKTAAAAAYIRCVRVGP